MASNDNTIEFQIKAAIQTAETAKSLAEVKSSLKELVSLQSKVDGKDFKKLANAINEVEGKLGDAADGMKTLTGSGVDRLKSSFGLLTEGFKNFDTGKIQIALKGVGTAMKAIPVFLILEGIRYLIENFEKLSQGTGLLGKILRGIGDVIDWVKEKVYALTDALGITNSTLDKQSEQLKKNAEVAKESLSQQSLEYDNLIAKAKASGKNTVELEKQKQQAIIDTNKALVEQAIQYVRNGGKLTDEQRKQLTEQLNAIKTAKTQQFVIQETADKEALEKFKKRRDEETQYRLEQLNLQFKYEQDLNKRREEEDKALSKSITDNLNATINQQQQAEKDKFLIENRNDQNRLAEKKALYKLNLEDRQIALKAEKDLALSSTDLTEQQRVEIIKKYNEDVKKLNEDNLKQTLDNVNKYTTAIANVANQVVGVFQALANLQAQKREQEIAEYKKQMDEKVSALNEAKDLELKKEGLTNAQKARIQYKYALAEYQLKLDAYNKETELRKKSFEQEKKLKIATAIISTITGAIAAFTGMAQAFPGPWGLALGAIAAAAVAATGAIQIAQIKNTKFEAGQAPTPPKMTMPDSSEPSASSAPSTGTSAKTSELEKIGGNNNNNNSSNEPQKVYVVATDISTAQNKNAVLERKATL